LAAGLVCLVGGAGAGQAGKGAPKLRGTWRGVSAILNGKQIKKAKKEYYLVLADKTFQAREEDRVVARGTFEADPSKKPAEIDLTITDGPVAVKGLTLYGIYEVKGKVLRFCVTSLGADQRPKLFTSEEDGGFLLLTLEREKN
jgi:uncharacterized protein (TIGR03067 family)